jgi:hypothetical protein
VTYGDRSWIHKNSETRSRLNSGEFSYHEEECFHVSHLLTDELQNADELGQYRSLSTLAVAALVLGLCSPLAFVGPLLLAIPLISVAVAWLALARIRASANCLTGRPLAIAGIVLAVVFAVASLTHVYVRDKLSTRLAGDAAQRWLSLVSADRIDEALEVMTPEALMKLQPPPPSRDVPRSPFEREKAVELLREDPLAHALEAAQEGKSVRFELGDKTSSWAEPDPQIGCKFQARGAQADMVEGSVVLSRRLSPQGGVAWLVDSWSLIQPPPEEFQAHQRR